MTATASAKVFDLNFRTAAWAEPHLEPARYKGAKGGRSRGASHFFAELAVEAMVMDPHLRFVCIREVQKSLQYSAKAVVEQKIRAYNLEWGPHNPHGLFRIMAHEIRRVNGGTGLMIFQGMQDHTADSIKSLEGFGRAWVEEAQSISKRSMELLLPTIRLPGSEIWFSWNPEQPEDPVEKLFISLAGARYPVMAGMAEGYMPTGERWCVTHSNYTDNPFKAENAVSIGEARRVKALDADAYEHVWMGGYDTKGDSKVLGGHYVVEEFTPDYDQWDGPYHGADHGFAMDPRTLVRCWVGPHETWGPRCLYIERESYEVKLSIDATAARWAKDVPGFDRYVVRADAAEPGTNDFLRRHGVPLIQGVKKWQGSVEDGIAHLRSYDKIIIHERCKNAQDEARLYSYKVDKKSGDVLPQIEDKWNHIWDAVRYALGPLIKPGKTFVMR